MARPRDAAAAEIAKATGRLILMQAMLRPFSGRRSGINHDLNLLRQQAHALMSDHRRIITAAPDPAHDRSIAPKDIHTVVLAWLT